MSLNTEAIREYYRRVRPVFEALATVDEYPTIGLNDYVGWYIKRDHGDVEAIEAGYPRQGRVARLDRDYDEIVDRLERTLYAVTTYKTPAAFQQWEPCRYDEEEQTTVWQDEAPTPDYYDLRAVPAWGDIDLADDIKPDRGDLDEETQTPVEETLAAYVDEYAELYGTRDAVYALDSVGGAYIFGAPEATLLIAEHFADNLDALGRVFDAFIDRSNTWLREAEQRVNARVDGAGNVVQPDWVNNKNRQYKPPLALHQAHDAVVTPLDVDDITYEMTSFEDVEEELIGEAASWVESLTAVEHTDCVESLVAMLWPEEYKEHGEWRTALEAWVATEREREREKRRQREQALQRRRERIEEHGNSVQGIPITPLKQDIYDAVAAIDITEIAEQYASDAYDTDPSQPRPQFNPSWRRSEGGQSCFVDEQENTFGDSKVNAGGGPAKLMALATGIIGDARDELDGEAYWEAVDVLRDAGYEIPVWIPDAGSDRADGDSNTPMPFWAVKKAAVVLEICSRDEFVERDGNDGTYEGFPNYEVYNEALEAIEEAGLDHGREPVTPDTDNRGDQATTSTPRNRGSSSGELSRVHLLERNQLLEAKVEKLSNRVDEQAKTIEELEQENSSLRAEITEKRQERKRLKEEIAALEEKLENYQDRESTASEQKERDRDSVLARVRKSMDFRK